MWAIYTCIHRIKIRKARHSFKIAYRKTGMYCVWHFAMAFTHCILYSVLYNGCNTVPHSLDSSFLWKGWLFLLWAIPCRSTAVCQPRDTISRWTKATLNTHGRSRRSSKDRARAAVCRPANHSKPWNRAILLFQLQTCMWCSKYK